MLLIFDLDDTLIPTSREITPRKLEEALKKMIDEGLEVAYQEGLETLFTINKSAIRSKEVLETFALLKNGNDDQITAGKKALEGSLGKMKVSQDLQLNNLLKEWKQSHNLAIVTGGISKVQNEKIDLYGIDRALFEEIIVSEWGEKEKAYIALKERFGPFLVVGDRIANDLTGAKKIGGITIHIRQGRGEFEPKNHPDVDHEIETINELTEVLGKYDNK